MNEVMDDIDQNQKFFIDEDTVCMISSHRVFL